MTKTQQDIRFSGTESYIATTDLEMAVNAAVTLSRPLLIKGEPGTGKTQLALEVAGALGRPIFEWHVKSTAKAQQGLYEYDAVSRLRDSQLGDARVADIKNYIIRGKLWEAFDCNVRPVLLIDEIDKADIEFPNDLIELHNFKNGYCGISKIEDNRYCLCYLTDSENLKKYNGDIKKMEQEVLFKNPFLKAYFTKAKFLFEEPLAISQIKIGFKSAVENNILMAGDTAGNIAPLSGNGMSIAMRSSFELNKLLACYFKEKITRVQLEKKYNDFWKKQFKSRVNLSESLQKLLKSTSMTNVAISILKATPFLRNAVVKSTHGKPF